MPQLDRCCVPVSHQADLHRPGAAGGRASPEIPPVSTTRPGGSMQATQPRTGVRTTRDDTVPGDGPVGPGADPVRHQVQTGESVLKNEVDARFLEAAERLGRSPAATGARGVRNHTQKSPARCRSSARASVSAADRSSETSGTSNTLAFSTSVAAVASTRPAVVICASVVRRSVGCG